MSRATLVPVAIGFACGVVASTRGVELIAMCASLVAVVAIGTRFGPIPLFAFIALSLGVLDQTLFSGSVSVTDVHATRFPVRVVDTRVEADGLVATTVRMADATLATTTLRPPAPEIGARLVIRGLRVPFDGSRNPGEPSAQQLAAERGLSCRIVHVRVVSTQAADTSDATLWIPRLRAWASARIHERFGEPAATILAGAMWGERGTLAPDLKEEFQETGTVHILVTAGLHLGVVAAFTIGLLELLRCGRIGSSLVAIVVVWFYAALSGDHLPSVRAATMLSFALLARAAGREPLSWNALALAGIVVAAVKPSSVTSVSFALSFSCVAAIFAFAKPLTSVLEDFGAPPLVREALGVALATQLGTWPLTASAFLVIAPYAPLANALVVPIVGAAMIGGFVTLALAPLPSLATIAANIDTTLIDYIIAVIRFVATLPGAHVIATPPPIWTIALYDVALAGAAALLARGRPLRAVLAVGAASSLCLWPPYVPSHDLVITAIDVGQADALLIKTPHGHAYLVDAGGRLERGPQQLAGTSSSEEVGERIVVPFLIRSGIHHLDAVLLSHPHGDHAGGLAPVLRTLGADGFADSGQGYPGHAYHDALDAAQTRHIPMLEPRGGDVWRTDDGVTFRFYGPTLPYIVGSRSDINSNSLVFRLEYGAFTMLFMGDAGSETEERLLASGVDLHATVLKVGHHGSAYGTTHAFVAAVEPRIAVISVGRHNLFGHPAPQTLRMLRESGASTYRTDDDGAVTITVDGASVKVEKAVRQGTQSAATMPGIETTIHP